MRWKPIRSTQRTHFARQAIPCSDVTSIERTFPASSTSAEPRVRPSAALAMAGASTGPDRSARLGAGNGSGDLSGTTGARSAADQRVHDDGIVVLEGTLSEVDLETVLRLIAGSRRSGQLVVSAPRPARFLFSTGLLVGGMAEQDGMLMSSTARGIDPTEPVETRLDNLVTALATALIPSAATFRFELGTSGIDRPLTAFDLDEVLSDAHHRLDAWRVIADVIPSIAMVVSLAAELPPELEQVVLGRADWQVLAAVDGRRSVAEIMASLRRSAFDVCSTLYRLITLGVVAIPAEPPVEPLALPATRPVSARR